VRDVRAVVFDLDDTLWEVGPVIVRAEHAMLEFLAGRYPRVLELHTLDSMRDLRARMAIEHPAMRHDFTWLRTQALLEHAREAGYPDDMAHEAFEVFYRTRNQVALYDDVLPALARLSARYRLFAVSNGNADLAAVGIADWFEGALAAREAGCLKPDPRIFRQLLDRAGLEPDDALHVGDDPVADVEGARRAGLGAVWVNRRGTPWPDGLEPPARTVRTLGELVSLLGA
jgi:putative hydrolase of the HAD superfamily